MKSLQQAAKELAGLAAVTAHRLTLQSELSLSVTGSVLLLNPGFSDHVITEIEAMGVRLARKINVEHPVFGAVNMAARLAGIHVERSEG